MRINSFPDELKIGDIVNIRLFLRIGIIKRRIKNETILAKKRSAISI